MARTKLKRIKEVESFENVFVNPAAIAGKWREKFAVKNNYKIVLELACGHGHYTLDLAKKFPQAIFLGVDKKGDRLWKAAKLATEQNLKNVGFLKCRIENLDEYFAETEIDEIWITFPDPYSKPSRARHRLTAPKFLEIYKKILRSGGKIHLKTDNRLLFDYSLETFKNTGLQIEEVIEDVHGSKAKFSSRKVADLLKICTYYEKKFMVQGIKIKYLRVVLL